MSNLLLITDVARLRKVFGRLAEDKNIRLRVVNNLEKGGEEIAIEKPDVVFVQTHLSGLSAEILLMHLKKQLGRKRSRFVLLASPGQTSDAALKQYQGWLDTSAEDAMLLSELQRLLTALLIRPKKTEDTAAQVPPPPLDSTPQHARVTTSHNLTDADTVTKTASAMSDETGLQLPAVAPPKAEIPLEGQGVTYAPRQRLSVYSEFTSSFDNAVNNTPEPETLEQAVPSTNRNWDAESIDTVEVKNSRSRKVTFLLWLAPVVVAVVIITFLQQQRASIKPESPATAAKVPAVIVKPAVPAVASTVPTSVKPPVAAPTATGPATPQDQDRMSDKAVLTAIAESRPKSAVPSATPANRLTELPDFIPRYGLDKQFGADNPGWELYKGQVTEFKVFREAKSIKAIQIIDRGGNGVPESFMKGVLRQVAKSPVFNTDSTEKKDEYEIQRGRISDNIKVVYYRDNSGGKLRAFVLTWQ